MIEVRVPCSPEQEDLMMEFALSKGPIVMAPGERVWMLSQLRRKHPTGRIVAADLDIEDAEWILSVE